MREGRGRVRSCSYKMGMMTGMMDGGQMAIMSLDDMRWGEIVVKVCWGEEYVNHSFL